MGNHQGSTGEALAGTVLAMLTGPMGEHQLSDKLFLDLAAIFSTPPTQGEIESCMSRDSQNNPHNDNCNSTPPRRDRREIEADLRYLHAHELLKARGRTVAQLQNQKGSGRR